MDFGESAFGVTANIGKVKCPFKLTGPQVATLQPENPKNDDKPSARRVQENNGGTLGENLSKTSKACDGASDTVNDIHRPPTRRKGEPKKDSSTTSPPITVRVKDDGKDYEFKTAAHHLIPGNASLKNAATLRKFMEKNKKAPSAKGKTYTIKEHIGYNINGAHNGVWLPGNYGIRPGKGPKKRTGWGGISNDPKYQNWCYDYMLACAQKAGGQFHDSHPKYSKNVLGVLNKIARKLQLHLDDCPTCSSNAGKKVYPPYVLKKWLYAFSGALKTRCKVTPPRVRFPWCTSDKFAAEMATRGHAANAVGFTG